MAAKRGKDGGPSGTLGSCSAHGRQSFASRQDAKRHGRRLSPGEHVNAYPCDGTDGLWHWGPLAPTVSRGKMSRSQRYDLRS